MLARQKSKKPPIAHLSEYSSTMFPKQRLMASAMCSLSSPSLKCAGRSPENRDRVRPICGRDMYLPGRPTSSTHLARHRATILRDGRQKAVAEGRSCRLLRERRLLFEYRGRGNDRGDNTVLQYLLEQERPPASSKPCNNSWQLTSSSSTNEAQS